MQMEGGSDLPHPPLQISLLTSVVCKLSNRESEELGYKPGRLSQAEGAVNKERACWEMGKVDDSLEV